MAYDESPHSKSGLEWAIFLGINVGAKLELIKVFEPFIRHYTRSDCGINDEIAKQYAEMEKAERQMMEEVKAELVAIKIIDPLELAMIYSMPESRTVMKLGSKLAELDETDRHILDEAKSAAALKGLKIGTELLIGDNIADVISQYAEENNADMIVAGTLGLGLLRELLMGSVTRKLISLSKAPVMVVKC